MTSLNHDVILWRSWYPREKSLREDCFGHQWPTTSAIAHTFHLLFCAKRYETLQNIKLFEFLATFGARKCLFFWRRGPKSDFFSFPIQAYGRVQLKNQFYHRISENLVLIFCKVTQSKGRKIMGLKMFSRKKLYCETENSYILYCALCGG